MRKFLAAILAGIMTVSLAACGNDGGTSSSSGSAGTSKNQESGSAGQKTIGIILKTLNSEYWRAMQAGIKQAEEDFGVRIVLQGPASETAFDEQLNMIETMLSAGEVDALILAPLQPDTAANAVANASIPVLAVDTNFEAPNLVSYVGISNESATYAGGKHAVENIGEGARVAILAGVQGDLTSEDRIKGWTAGVEEAGGEVIAVQYTDAATDRAVSAMEGILQMFARGEIDAVLCHSDDVAMGVANAIIQADRTEILVYGFGGISGAQPVKDGILTATVDIGPYMMGYTAVQKAIDAIEGKDVEPFIDAGATILDKNNIDEFLGRLKEWTN